MKKLSLILVAIAFVSLVACKKDRVCSCTDTGVTYKVTLNDATKRQAASNCVSYTEDTGNGTSNKVTCELSK